MTDIYEEGFKEFLEEGIDAESKGHYRAAASNYYKALTELCSLLIAKQIGKVPNNHTEIFLFLKINFPEIDELIKPAYKIYTKAYDSSIDKEECIIVKDVIKKITAKEEFSEKIRRSAEKI
jgi:hypothetical protein